jgi:sugar phosphate isomerase/epimerase
VSFTYTRERVLEDCAKAIYTKTELSQKVAFDLLPRKTQQEMQDIAKTVLDTAEAMGWKAP